MFPSHRPKTFPGFHLIWFCCLAAIVSVSMYRYLNTGFWKKKCIYKAKKCSIIENLRVNCTENVSIIIQVNSLYIDFLVSKPFPAPSTAVCSKGVMVSVIVSVSTRRKIMLVLMLSTST